MGLTDQYEPSLCLLHYMPNRSLAPWCDCNLPSRHSLGRTQIQAIPSSLLLDLLAKMDAHTSIDESFCRSMRQAQRFSVVSTGTSCATTLSTLKVLRHRVHMRSSGLTVTMEEDEKDDDEFII